VRNEKPVKKFAGETSWKETTLKAGGKGLVG